MSANMGVTPEDKPLSVSGRNWGDADLDGEILMLYFFWILSYTVALIIDSISRKHAIIYCWW